MKSSNDEVLRFDAKVGYTCSRTKHFSHLEKGIEKRWQILTRKNRHNRIIVDLKQL